MKSSLSAMSIPAILATSLLGCSSVPVDDSSEVGATQSEVTSCPTTVGTSEPQQRAAADLAFRLMRLAATQAVSVSGCFANTILAPQRYAIRSSGSGIEFRRTDPLFLKRCVTDEMIATLAMAQDWPDLATFLSNGQKTAYATTNGQYYPSVDSAMAFANYTLPNSKTTQITDSNGTHTVTISADPWCSTMKITMKDTIKTYMGWSPVMSREVVMLGYPWLSSWQGLGFAPTSQSNQKPYTPFAGPSGNPYLLISVNNVTATSWDAFNWTSSGLNWNCGSGSGCTGYVEFDPAPYAEPGTQYGTTSTGTIAPIGSDPSVPYTIVSSPYASDDHKCAYGTLSGVMGRFANRKQSTSNGLTVTNWAWTKMDLVPNYKDPGGNPWCR